MAAYDYTRLRKKGFDLITRFGRDVTFLKYSRSAADVAKPWRGPTNASPSTSVTVKAVLIGDRFLDDVGELSRRGEIDLVLVAAKSTSENLEGFEKVNDSGRLRDVESVELIHPGPSRLLYLVKVKK